MPFTAPSPRHRRFAAAALASLAVVPIAGCGSSDSSSAGSNADLAALAPATSLAYVQATLAPDGDQKEAVDAVSSKVLREKDPATAIQRSYDKSNGAGSYAKEIEPWLGDEAAVVVTGVQQGADDPDVAVLVEPEDDPQQGVDAIVKSSKTPTKKGSYGGTDFVQGDDFLTGVVKDEVVIASTPAAFRAVVDASKTDGLDKKVDFKNTMDALPGDPIGSAWVDVKRVFQIAAQRDPSVAAQSQTIERSIGKLRGVGVGLDLTKTSIKLTSVALGAPASSGDAATSAASLPAGSWLAAGLGDVGASLTKGLQQLQAGGGADARQVQQGLAQIKQQTGIDVQQDLLSWMGEGGIFVRGSGITDIGGALVVTTKDPATTKASLVKVRRLVEQAGQKTTDLSGNGVDEGFSITPSGAPVEVLVATGGTKVVVAVNRAALQEALSTTRPLSDDPAFKAAGEALGDGVKPSFFLDVRTVVSLASLAAGSDPSFQQARPYLDAFTTIAGGGSRDGDVAKQTLAIGLR